MASLTRRISSAASRAGSGPVGQALREALPLDEAHREIMLALVLADLEDRHDARMVEVGRRLGLDVEPPHVGLGRELAGKDHLECDRPVQADLPRPVHHAHAAACDLLDQFVIAEIADTVGSDTPGLADGSWPSTPVG